MNEYVTVGATARAHSDNGNLKDNGSLTFVYDYKNRLIGAFDKATNNPVAAYLYYCDNRRAKKIVYSQTSPGVVERQERFFYDGQQVVEETDDAGNTLLSWVYSPVYVDEPVQMVRSASHSLGAGTFYLHQNARADVVAVTDSAGSVVERRLFDDYGRSFNGVSKAPVSGSAVGNVYGFQGRRLDAETGLYYLRARSYDPSTGRFVQRDPVWDPGNFGNQYSFVGNGPVSGRDPRGDQGVGEWRAAEEKIERKNRARASRKEVTTPLHTIVSSSRESRVPTAIPRALAHKNNTGFVSSYPWQPGANYNSFNNNVRLPLPVLKRLMSGKLRSKAGSGKTVYQGGSDLGSIYNELFHAFFDQEMKSCWLYSRFRQAAKAQYGASKQWEDMAQEAMSETIDTLVERYASDATFKPPSPLAKKFDLSYAQNAQAPLHKYSKFSGNPLADKKMSKDLYVMSAYVLHFGRSIPKGRNAKTATYASDLAAMKARLQKRVPGFSLK